MRSIFEKLGLSPHQPPQINDYLLKKADRREGIQDPATEAREEAGRQTDAWFKEENLTALEEFVALHMDIRDNLHHVARKAAKYARSLRERLNRTH